MGTIHTLAGRWLEQDRDEETRAEITQLVQDNDTAELEKRLRNRIAFGTAGLRSSMKAGFAHMNSLIVLATSTGLADYILAQKASTASTLSAAETSVVIGYDGRYRSEKFARLAAAAFLQRGFKVLWFARLVHTPLVPFSVMRYKASAGVMITASHNPKNDNGYKVYWANGSQIIPPHDRGIARAIESVQTIPTWDHTLVDQPQSHVEMIFEDACDAYLAAVTKLAGPQLPTDPVLPFVYTPMHGVGLPFMQQSVERLKIPTGTMHVVEAQAYPDPEFPTVAFPNPEEHGALTLAIRQAETNNVRIIIANDPDADRFSAAERLADGGVVQFSGNQLGILFAAYVIETSQEQMQSSSAEPKQLAMLASTVSSRMLASMAAQENFHFVDTLTGFKWLGNVAQDLAQAGTYTPVFAFEEAIGYMFPSVVWDKDGVAAAAVFLAAWRRWHAQGLTPWTKLQQLYDRYGHFEDANTYVASPSPQTTKRVFDAIRALGGEHRAYPETVGSRRILYWRDLTVGYDSKTSDHVPTLPIDPSAQMITCALEDDVIFTTRGSGTEPKIKFYIEAKAASSAEAKSRANDVLHDLLREWFKPEYGLRLAGT